MDDLLSEKEQIEEIRAWWSQYGGYIIGGIGLGIALLVGLNYYEGSKRDAQLGGSALFESLTDHVVTGRLEEAEGVVADLNENYGNTTYAAQSRLALARLYMDQNRDQDAADQLRAVVDGDVDPAVEHVARTRLARILQYQGDSQGVIDLLDGAESDAFEAVWNVLRGDAYADLGQIAEAAVAYQAAQLHPSARDTIDLQLVQWKIVDLPPIEEAPAEDAADEEPADEAAVEEPEAEASE